MGAVGATENAGPETLGLKKNKGENDGHGN